MSRALVFFLLVLVVPGAHASADVIGPNWRPPRCPDLACPPGSAPIGSGSHSACSPGCGASRTCDTDADCAAMGEGAACIETRFCIESVPGHLGVRSIVRGTCDDEDGCGSGDSATPCSVVRRCAAPERAAPAVPPAEPPPSAPPPEPPAESPSETPPAQSSGGCAVGPVRAASPWPLALLALFVARSVRQKSERSSRK